MQPGPVVAMLMALLALGCAPIPPAPPAEPAENPSLDALKAEVARLNGELSNVQSALADVRTEQQTVATELDVQTHAIGRVEGAVATLPESLKGLCPTPQRAETQCKDPEIQRVVIKGSKMVVGDVEQVWIDPPGIPLIARIDTTTANNALLGEEIVEFERDGKSWVRFVMRASDSDDPIALERRVVATHPNGSVRWRRRHQAAGRADAAETRRRAGHVLVRAHGPRRPRGDTRPQLPEGHRAGRSGCAFRAAARFGARERKQQTGAMTQRGPFLFLVLLLVAIGVGSATFRHIKFNIPFLPGTQETVWQIEAKINFWGDGEPVQAILSLPSNQARLPHRQ